MATNRETQLVITILTERIERETGKKVILNEITDTERIQKTKDELNQIQKYYSLSEKISDYKGILQNQIEDLELERQEVEIEKENDMDVLENPNDGSNPAVIAYRDSLERIDKQIDVLRNKIKKADEKLLAARPQNLKEDNYYEPQAKSRDKKKDIQTIVDNFAKESVGDNAWAYVRGQDGQDIEIGGGKYFSHNLNKEIIIKMDRTEWQEVADELIEKLAHEGYTGYEVDLLGETGFRMSCTLDESVLKEEVTTADMAVPSGQVVGNGKKMVIDVTKRMGFTENVLRDSTNLDEGKGIDPKFLELVKKYKTDAVNHFRDLKISVRKNEVVDYVLNHLKQKFQVLTGPQMDKVKELIGTEMFAERKQLAIKILTERIEKLINKKVVLIENAKLAKQNYLDKGLISQEEYDNLVNIDPTSSKKYVLWLTKKYKEENISIDDLKNTIEEFDVFVRKNKLTREKADINSYKTFNDLKNTVDNLNQTGEGMSLKELENDYDVIVNNEDLYIVSPKTHEASRKLGLTTFAHRDSGDCKDSAWCTTYKSESHFNDYYLKRNVTFYYILVKSKKMLEQIKQTFPTGYKNLVKVAFAVLPDGRVDAYDAMDKQMNAKSINAFRKVIGL